MMTNEQLLELAELDLKSAHRPNITTDQSISASQNSLSASLLVLARNSIPINVKGVSDETNEDKKV